MLQSNYNIYVVNCVQEEPIKDYEYLNIIHKVIGMLIRGEHDTIEIRHKNIVLITFIRIFNSNTITVKFDKHLYEECNYSTILNAYISNAINNANKHLKTINRYEKDFGSDFDVDAERIAQSTDNVKGK